MPNNYGAPEITVQEVANKQSDGQEFILMDVREPAELTLANLGDEVIAVPLSKLTRDREAALPDELRDQSKEIVVFCHSGVRSAQVTAWLLSQGWTNVNSMQGGIDAYARDIDPTVGFY